MIYINENFKATNEVNNTYKSTFSNNKCSDNGIDNVLKDSTCLTEENLKNNNNNVEYNSYNSDNSDNSDDSFETYSKKKRKRSISTETLFGHLIMEDFNNLNINKSKSNNDNNNYNNNDNYKLLLEINEKINNIEKNIESKNLENFIQEELTAKISKINKTSIVEFIKINTKIDQIQNKFDKILAEKDYVIEHLKDEINNLKDEMKSTQYNNNDHYC